ncbi:MAG: hypothetical protein U0822_25880 [Anaerolineae bacterium]
MANRFLVAGPNSKYAQPEAQPAGFWVGVWHGLIAPIVLIASIFTPNVRIYEPNNRGRLYDLGFLIGVIVVFGGSKAQPPRMKAPAEPPTAPEATISIV